jgi:hypothetical protein
MAITGTKLWASGDVVTAADVNQYLMRGVKVFADSTARTNAYGGAGEPTLEEGEVAYLLSDNTVYVYDGSAWKAVGVASIIDAKGDLLVGSADDTVAKQTVGANGTVLMADSGQTNGIVWTEQSLGYRNVVINGAMQIAQRGTSVASITTDGYKTADRYVTQIASLGTWTQSVENDAPTGSGFRKSLKMLCTTADASPASSDYIILSQFFEGQNVQQFLKGTASAKQFTLSFWVKSNVTGTYIVNLRDLDNSRNVGASYTISASATWEKKTITFPADTTGAFDNDNAGSLRLTFNLAVGSQFSSGTLQTTWGSVTDANIAVGQTNLAAATNNYWQITGVQLEAGAVATPFEFEDYGVTLAKCQRYYWRQGGDGTVLCNVAAYTSTAVYGVLQPKETMRATPTLEQVSGTNYFTFLSNNTSDFFDSIGAISDANVESVRIDVTSGISAVQGHAGWIRTANANTSVALLAEL